jgi:hypothetical protein
MGQANVKRLVDDILPLQRREDGVVKVLIQP